MQIVRSYFGGRDISTNDIKEALLVGMSPYERRKLQKKRNGRLSNRNNSLVISQSTKDIFNDENISVSAKDNFSRVNENIISETFINPDFPSNQALNEIGAFNLVKKGVCAGKNTTNDSYDCEDKSPSEDNVVSYYSSNGISARHAKKLSLLGHGPHGRQVVDYILKEQGENGVLQFCQRWRQVFIDCIHPRYLPSGWDVMHRYGIYVHKLFFFNIISFTVKIISDICIIYRMSLCAIPTPLIFPILNFLREFYMEQHYTYCVYESRFPS